MKAFGMVVMLALGPALSWGPAACAKRPAPVASAPPASAPPASAPPASAPPASAPSSTSAATAAVFAGFDAVDVPFSSRRMAAFSQGTPEEDGHVGRDGTLRGFLRLPPGARRAPFALLLHGCAGLAGNTAFGLRDWADWLQARGVGALVLDSFGPRGVRRTCGPSDGHWAHRRVDDLFSAITYLHDRGLVPEGHVFALGQSNGGRTVMNAAAVSEYDRSARLAGAFALYPYCGDDARTEFVRPLAIFTPERDEHNRPEECQRLSRGGRRFASPTVVRLQGATHSYDVRAPLREDRGNVMEFSESGLSRTREAVSAFLDRLGRPAAPEPADRY